MSKISPRISLGICLLAAIFISTDGWGYKEKEHKAINEYILDNSIGGFVSDQYAKQYLGFDGGMNDKCISSISILNWLTFTDYKSPKDLIARGGMEEDQPFTRVRFHFHDPMKTWDNAGLLGANESLVLWSQHDKGEQSLLNGGNYSWHDAREYFHMALTAGDMEHRNTAFRNTFLAVGHLMHLVQDISVPEHARDDTHVLGYTYEHIVQYL